MRIIFNNGFQELYSSFVPEFNMKVGYFDKEIKFYPISQQVFFEERECVVREYIIYSHSFLPKSTCCIFE